MQIRVFNNSLGFFFGGGGGGGGDVGEQAYLFQGNKAAQNTLRTLT